MSNKNPQHYVDNKKLYENMKIYINDIKHAKLNNLPKPPISEEIALDIIAIANKMINRTSSVSYNFREDMISDGIENCLLYAHNFNPEYKNPFAYFSQIISFAYVRKIKKEKLQLRVKYGAIMEGLLNISKEDYALIQKYGTDFNDLKMREFIDDYDKREAEKKAEKKLKEETKHKDMDKNNDE